MSLTYQQLKTRSPLTMEKSFTEDEHQRIKVKIVTPNGNFSEYLPPLLLEHGEQTLYAITEFDAKAALYQFDDNDHFNYFDRLMTSAVRQEWKAIIAPMAQTVANFQLARTTLLQQLFDEESLEHYTEYLQMYRKPAYATARSTLMRFRVIDTYRTLLPTATASTDMEKKKAYLRMFPKPQQDSFKRAKSIITTSLNEMATFFGTYDTLPTASKPKKHTRNNDGGDHDSSNHHTKRAKDNKGNHTTQSNKGNNTNQKRGSNLTSTTGGPNNQHMCSIHSHLGDNNHSWWRCIYNKRGPKYDEAADRRRRERLNKPPPTGPGHTGTQQAPHQYHYHGIPIPPAPAPPGIPIPPPAPTGTTAYYHSPSMAPPSVPFTVPPSVATYYQHVPPQTPPRV